MGTSFTYPSIKVSLGELHLLICIQFLPLLILFTQNVLVVNIITTYSGIEDKFWQEDISQLCSRAAAARLWNKLPSNIRVNFNSLSVNQFKNAVAS